MNNGRIQLLLKQLIILLNEFLPIPSVTEKPKYKEHAPYEGWGTYPQVFRR